MHPNCSLNRISKGVILHCFEMHTDTQTYTYCVFVCVRTCLYVCSVLFLVCSFFLFHSLHIYIYTYKYIYIYIYILYIYKYIYIYIYICVCALFVLIVVFQVSCRWVLDLSLGFVIFVVLCLLVERPVPFGAPLD